MASEHSVITDKIKKLAVGLTAAEIAEAAEMFAKLRAAMLAVAERRPLKDQ
jgi:hypothetical protein